MLGIWNSGNGISNWSASVNATWLHLGQTSGSWEGSAVAVAVDISQMSAGNYSATITISASEATNRFQAVPVSLTIMLPSAIGYSSSSLYFTATEGASNPPIQPISIWNSGGGTLDWSIRGNASWLNLSPTIGSSAGNIRNGVTVAADISGVSAGNYSATITISASEATNTPQTIPVSLTINPVPPTPTPAPTPTPTPTPTATPTPTPAPPPAQRPTPTSTSAPTAVRIPTITIAPYAGPPGTTATINGASFHPYAAVAITIGGVKFAQSPITDAAGNFSARVTIPSLQPRFQVVMATDQTNMAATVFQITAPTPT